MKSSYETHLSALHTQLAGLVRRHRSILPHAILQELAQDTLLQLHRWQTGGGEVPQGLAGWEKLTFIVWRNLLRRTLRRQQLRAPVELAAAGPLVTGPAAQNKLELQEFCASLQEGWAQLSLAERRVLLLGPQRAAFAAVCQSAGSRGRTLAAWVELPPLKIDQQLYNDAEIAVLSGLAASSVKKTRHRARCRLQKICEQQKLDKNKR